MRDDDRRPRRARRGAKESSKRPTGRGRFDDLDERDDEDPPPRRGGGARRSRSASPQRKKGWFGFGSGSARPAARRGRGRGRGRGSGGREGFDWSAAEDDDFEDGPRYADRGADEPDDDEEPTPARRRSRRPEARKKLTLMDLCTPVFGCAAILPQEASGPQPGYEQFRAEVLSGIQKIENEAPDNGIELEDARLAAYGLCFFMDNQVAGSEWAAKGQWAAEPLGIVLQQDAEGGVNFFKRLDGLGDRQREVKEVYLVCLALGFRGKYAELEATQQAAKIGEIRQKLVRSIHPVPMEKQPELFPEAYEPADAIEDEVPPPPRWWIWASLGAVAFAAAFWVLLFLNAGGTSKSNEEKIRRLLEDSAAATPGALVDGGANG